MPGGDPTPAPQPPSAPCSRAETWAWHGAPLRGGEAAQAARPSGRMAWHSMATYGTAQHSQRTPGMPAGVSRAASVQHGPNSPQISTERQLRWREHGATTPAWLPLVLNYGGFAGEVHSQEVQAEPAPRPAVFTQHSQFRQSPLGAGTAAGIFLGSKYSPSVPRASVKLMPPPHTPSLRACSVQGQGSAMGNLEATTQTRQTHTFSSLFPCFVARREPGPPATAAHSAQKSYWHPGC